MATQAERRERTRSRIADAAATLFAQHGYDQVVVLDVARAADVSEQTVYNYFPAKQDLVLDRADEILERYQAAVETRGAEVGPARAVRDLVRADTEWIGVPDPGPARGMFLAQAVSSNGFRRFALEFRARQVTAVTRALAVTDPGLSPMLAEAFAASLVAVAQHVADAVGRHIVGPGSPGEARAVRQQLLEELDQVLDHLDRAFTAISAGSVSLDVRA